MVRLLKTSLLLTIAGAGLTAGQLLAAPAAGAVVAGQVAGYSAPPSAAATQTVSVRFVVPKLNCSKVPSGGFQAVLSGARLITASGNTGGGAALICPGPTASYSPIIEIDGSSIGSGIVISAGDTVTVKASESAAGSTVTLTDGAQSQTASGPGGSVTEEDVGDIAVNCMGTACAPVPKAAVTKYSAAMIDRQNLVTAGAVQENLVDAAGGVEMSSGALITPKSFKVTWVSSCGTGPGRC
jgi:hypothetical protein